MSSGATDGEVSRSNAAGATLGNGGGVDPLFARIAFGPEPADDANAFGDIGARGVLGFAPRRSPIMRSAGGGSRRSAAGLGEIAFSKLAASADSDGCEIGGGCVPH